MTDLPIDMGEDEIAETMTAQLTIAEGFTHFQRHEQAGTLRRRQSSVREMLDDWLGIEQPSIADILSFGKMPQASLRIKNQRPGRPPRADKGAE